MCDFTREKSNMCALTGLGHYRTFDGFNFEHEYKGEFKMHDYTDLDHYESVHVIQETHGQTAADSVQDYGAGVSTLSILRSSPGYSSGNLVVRAKPGFDSRSIELLYFEDGDDFGTNSSLMSNIAKAGFKIFSNGLKVSGESGKS